MNVTIIFAVIFFWFWIGMNDDLSCQWNFVQCNMHFHFPSKYLTWSTLSVEKIIIDMLCSHRISFLCIIIIIIYTISISELTSVGQANFSCLIYAIINIIKKNEDWVLAFSLHFNLLAWMNEWTSVRRSVVFDHSSRYWFNFFTACRCVFVCIDFWNVSVKLNDNVRQFNKIKYNNYFCS